MPKYKLSPEEWATEKERKGNLRNIMKGLDVKSFDNLKDVHFGDSLQNEEFLLKLYSRKS